MQFLSEHTVEVGNANCFHQCEATTSLLHRWLWLMETVTCNILKNLIRSGTKKKIIRMFDIIKRLSNCDFFKRILFKEWIQLTLSIPLYLELMEQQ